MTRNMRHEIGKLAKKTPMTAAERQRKHRARVKRFFAKMTPEKRFRYDLYWFVQNYRLLHPKVTNGQMAYALRLLSDVLVVPNRFYNRWLRRYLDCERDKGSLSCFTRKKGDAAFNDGWVCHFRESGWTPYHKMLNSEHA